MATKPESQVLACSTTDPPSTPRRVLAPPVYERRLPNMQGCTWRNVLAKRQYAMHHAGRESAKETRFTERSRFWKTALWGAAWTATQGRDAERGEHTAAPLLVGMLWPFGGMPDMSAGCLNVHQDAL